MLLGYQFCLNDAFKLCNRIMLQYSKNGKQLYFTLQNDLVVHIYFLNLSSVITSYSSIGSYPLLWESITA